MAAPVYTWDNIARLNPSAATLTTLYTVPSSTQVVAVVNVTNRSATPTEIRISVAPSGAADNDNQYLDYDLPIGGNASYERVVTAAAADVIRVRATLATITFVLQGVSIT